MKLLHKSVRLFSWVFGIFGLFALLSVVGLIMGMFLLVLTLGLM